MLLPPVTLASGFQRRKDAAHHVGQGVAQEAKRPGGIDAVRPFAISLKALFLKSGSRALDRVFELRHCL